MIDCRAVTLFIGSECLVIFGFDAGIIYFSLFKTIVDEGTSDPDGAQSIKPIGILDDHTLNAVYLIRDSRPLKGNFIYNIADLIDCFIINS